MCFTIVQQLNGTTYARGNGDGLSHMESDAFHRRHAWKLHRTAPWRRNRISCRREDWGQAFH